MYDPLITRLITGDPLFRQFPIESNYIFAGNTPIECSDIDEEFKFSEATMTLLKEKYLIALKYFTQATIGPITKNILAVCFN